MLQTDSLSFCSWFLADSFITQDSLEWWGYLGEFDVQTLFFVAVWQNLFESTSLYNMGPETVPFCQFRGIIIFTSKIMSYYMQE